MHRTNILLKVLLFGALGTLFIPLTAYAQVHVGFVGGVNVATLTDDDPDVVGVSSQTRLSLGGVVDVALGRGFSLRAEPTILRKGAVESVRVDGVFGENEFLFSYLELPLLLSYTFGPGPVRPYLTAGPSVGLFLGTDDVVLHRPGGVFKADMDAAVERFDVGLALGSGVISRRTRDALRPGTLYARPH